MRALEWSDVNQMNIREYGIPELKPGWVLLKVGYTGICGSELSAYLGQNELRKPPSVMGHEFAGTVVKTASDEDSGMIGHSYSVNPLVTCGKCKFCKMGKRYLCPERKIIGVNYPGSFAEFVSVPASSCYRVEDRLYGSLVEPLATAFHAVELSDPEPDDEVLIIGAGTIGLMTSAVMGLHGVSSITVMETNPRRLDLAKNWGANEVLNPSSSVDANSSSRKYAIVIDAVGLDVTRRTSVNSVEPGGKVIFVGLHEPNSSVPGNLIVRNEIHISGSFCYSDDDFRRSTDLINKGFLKNHKNWFDVRDLEMGDMSFKEQLRPDSPFSKIILASEK